jgi:hypothetical protein
MTREEILSRWEARLVEWAQLEVHVDGAAIAREVLADLREIASAHETAELTLTAAANESGYSKRQLARMIVDGTLRNVGRPNAPRVLRQDLPRKLVAKPQPSAMANSSSSLLGIARHIVTAKSRRGGGSNGTQG